jgi:hypothetical protein
VGRVRPYDGRPPRTGDGELSEESPPPPTQARSLAARPWLARAAFESALIIFSVFLALALDAWREDAQTRRRVDEARSYFAQEIAANREQLASKDFAPQHRRMAAAWRRLAALPSPTADDRNRTWGQFANGMHPFTARDAVWRSFSASGLIEHMPPRELFMLSEIYRQQEELNVRNQAFLRSEQMVSADATEPRFVKSQAEMSRSSLEDVIYAERVLLRLYDEALRRLGQPAASA